MRNGLFCFAMAAAASGSATAAHDILQNPYGLDDMLIGLYFILGALIAGMSALGHLFLILGVRPDEKGKRK